MPTKAQLIKQISSQAATIIYSDKEIKRLRVKNDILIITNGNLHDQLQSARTEHRSVSDTASARIDVIDTARGREIDRLTLRLHVAQARGDALLEAIQAVK